MSDNMNSQSDRGSIDEGLEHIASQRGILHQVMSGEVKNQMPEMSDEEIENAVDHTFDKLGEMSEQLPEFIKNTVSIEILISTLPEEGIDISQVREVVDLFREMSPDIMPHMQTKVLNEAADKIDSMSDKEIISTVQDFLTSKGMEMDDLAARLEDGNLSKEDLTHGISELGYAANAQLGNGIENSEELTQQVREAMGDDVKDPGLLEGLVYAERYIDKIMTEQADVLAELYKGTPTGAFEKAASGEEVLPQNADENLVVQQTDTIDLLRP